MSADKHPAEVLAEKIEQFGGATAYQCAAMLRTIPALEAERDKLLAEQKQGTRHDLQAHGKHPAPCARFCEATAFRIEIRSLTAERDKLMDRHNALHVNAAKLRAEVEALRADVERLNFIEANPAKTLRCYKNRWSLQGLTDYEYEVHKTLRAAIDAERGAA